jgi:putative flippase GtrA
MDLHYLMPGRNGHPNKNQFLKFLAVGVLNTVFGYSVFAVFLYCGLHYPLAVFFSTCLGILFNFKTIGHLVFAQTGRHLIWRFIGVYAIVYLVSVTGLKLGGYFSHNYYLLAIFITPFTALLAYGLNRNFVFQGTNHAAY